MTDLLQWNNCAGCMRKRSLLSEHPSYMHSPELEPAIRDIELPQTYALDLTDIGISITDT
jgi:hypothetical protein